MQQRYAKVKQLTVLNGLKNIVLACVKIVTGVIGASHALVADGVHSLGDLLVDALVLVAAKYGAQAPDFEHPYGHARIETVANLGLALALVLTGMSIVYESGRYFWLSTVPKPPAPFVVWIALASLIVNEIIYRYMLAVGRRVQSDLLIASAMHNRSDVLAALIVFIGLVGSRLGYPYLDSVAAIVVGLLIIQMGGKIAKHSLTELIDTGLNNDTIKQVYQTILRVPGVKAVHDLRSRRMAGRALIEVHIIVDAFITVSEGHHISEKVTTALQNNIASLDNVIVHIDAENDEDDSSTRNLPLRAEIIPLLKAAWVGLPGFDDPPIRLHYLAGSIGIEVELPTELLPTDVAQLTHRYQAAISHLAYISQVRLLFV